MKLDFFKGEKTSYHVTSFFFRVEFQMRGAPHVHSLLWMKNDKKEDAPSFWTSEDMNTEKIKETVRKIEEMADILTTVNPDDMHCHDHNKNCESAKILKCTECQNLKAKASKFQTHNHTSTCHKKGKIITIRKNEGHGRLDGIIEGEELKGISVCRFRFPRFPMDRTRLVFGISQDMPEENLNTRKKDLRKIVTFLIRQYGNINDLNPIYTGL